MNRLKSSAIPFAIGMLVGSIVLSARQPNDAGRASAEKLVALKKERRDVLQKASGEAEELYKESENIYSEVAHVLINWRDAELDLAADRAARIKLRERMLERCKKIEDLVTERAKWSQQVAVDLLSAKAARLQAEIDLLQEQSAN